MPAAENAANLPLANSQRNQFLHEGFVKIENAFPTKLAAEGREILWRETGCDPNDPATWTRPVIRIADCAQEPFRQAANTPTLHAAFDAVVGRGRWLPRQSLGGWPIRFPHPDDPHDTGWHIDASLSPLNPNEYDETYSNYRINLRSDNRALLMLFLFSDVGEADAPTRIRVGSHLRIPKLLLPAGEEGLSGSNLGPAAVRLTEGMPEAYATGAAGTVYLCHPFLVHASQPHRGSTPRFLAQPPLYPAKPLELERKGGKYSLVEQAIRLGLGNHTAQ